MKRFLLIVAPAVLSVCFLISVSGHCHAEEELFWDGNPRYPLVSATYAGWRYYLDLDSCAVISSDADGFEISAKCKDPRFLDEDYTYRFRKNKESGGKLQVQYWYDKRWRTIYNPYDKRTIEQVLEKRDYIKFRLDNYYMFKCAYQEVFGTPYADAFDEEALRRSVLLLRRDGEKPGIHDCLWDDDNFPLIWYHGGGTACYIDKSSLFIEDENPPYCTLQILVLDTPQFHYNDIMPRSISQARYLYDDEKKIMYCNRDSKASWARLDPAGRLDKQGWWRSSVGEAAFRLAYGRDFYEGAKRDGHRYDRSVIYPSDKKLCTDKDGTSYYLRQFDVAHAWIEAQVMREKADGKVDSFLYYVYTYQVQCPYTIYPGTSSIHHGEAVERGELYTDSEGTLRGNANPSAVALFDWFWTEKLGREPRRQNGRLLPCNRAGILLK